MKFPSDPMLQEMLVEFQPLLAELQEGLYQYSIMTHVSYNELLMEVVKTIVE